MKSSEDLSEEKKEILGFFSPEMVSHGEREGETWICYEPLGLNFGKEYTIFNVLGLQLVSNPSHGCPPSSDGWSVHQTYNEKHYAKTDFRKNINFHSEELHYGETWPLIRELMFEIDVGAGNDKMIFEKYMFLNLSYT